MRRGTRRALGLFYVVGGAALVYFGGGWTAWTTVICGLLLIFGDRLFTAIARTLVRVALNRYCPRCRVQVRPILHVFEPFKCANTPPLGGWHEPHKDEL